MPGVAVERVDGRKVPPPGRARCKGTNKAGEPCRAAPPRGKEWCTAHDLSLPESARFGSFERASAAGKIGGPATRYPRTREVVERKIEESIEPVIGELIAAATSATALQVDKLGEEHVSIDYFTRARAADIILQRALGKPSQETTLHADIQAVNLNLDGSDPNVRKSLSSLLRARPVEAPGG